MWFELLGIMENVVFAVEDDQIVWSFSSTSNFSVQSLYGVINHRGVIPVCVHTVWKLKIPPMVQIFLWLLSKNKLLTRDNLLKRRDIDDHTCLFYSEPESINHLFFDCCVAKRLWTMLGEVLYLRGSWNFEFVASQWIANKNYAILNILSSALMWCLWKFRNKICFQGAKWMREQEVIRWTKMETNVQSRCRGAVGRSDPEVGGAYDSAPKHWVATGGSIGNVGFSVFGDGLFICDSVY